MVIDAIRAGIRPVESIRKLLAEVIDYAGLFPPAKLSMSEAVVNYATYRNSNYSWMLGRFVAPVARLDEFFNYAEDAIARDRDKHWRIAAVAGEDIQETIRIIKEFNYKNSGLAFVDVLEVKANTVSKIENTVNALPKGVTAYFEIANKEELPELVSALAIRKQKAKIRTGGITHDQFPPARQIIRFVRTCMAANVPFKATAGLHHPIRCFRPLTYEPDSPSGMMHGFLNLLLMTGFARESYRVSLLEELMEEEFEEVFKFDELGVSWRNQHQLNLTNLELLRQRGMHSFGSCSFEEPIADLEALGIL
jgi:hypothetical protein